MRKNTKKNLNLSSLAKKSQPFPPLIFLKNKAAAPLILKKKTEISLWPHTVLFSSHQHKPFSLTGIGSLFGSPVALPLSHKTATTYSFLLSQPHLSFHRPSPSLSKVFPSRQSKKTAHSRSSTQTFRLSLDHPPSAAHCPFHLHSQN